MATVAQPIASAKPKVDLGVLKRPGTVDGLFIVALGTVSLIGFEKTFQGYTYLIAGVAGTIFGVLLAALAARLRQPLIVLGVFTVAAFFLLGGVATDPNQTSGFFPLPNTLRTLANACVHGWHQLITTLPPIDGGVLIALPYLMGLVAGAAGMALALRWRIAALPLVAPGGLLAAVIGLGTPNAPHIVLIGAGFAVLALAWVVARGRRLARTTQLSGHALKSRLMALALCVVALAGAVWAGPSMPGIGAREVLRNQVTPPFNIGQYPSPLAGFRKYTLGYKGTTGAVNPLYDQPLFDVSGLPAGQPLQIATLDSYDGLVWGASNQYDKGPEPDAFQKVGHTIVNPQPGSVAHVNVTVDKGYGGVWLPTAGALTNVDFDGPFNANFKDLRYNLATGTAVVPGGVSPGDSYSFTTQLTTRTLTANTPAASSAWPQTMPTTGGGAFTTIATTWAGGGSNPVQRVLGLATYMRTNGRYTDGQDGYGAYLAGHSLRNLGNMVSPQQQLAGDDEQYAALLALMSNQLGVPARVVLGATGWAGNTITGKDIHAWVEVRLGDGNWYTLPTDSFVPDHTRTPDQLQPQTQQPQPAQAIPPPAPARPPSNLGDPLENGTSFKNHNGNSGFQIPGFVVAVFTYVGIPVLVIAAIIGLLILAKRERRKRRRTKGSPVHRISAGWRELLDYARDQGARVTSGLTRREQAAVLGLAGYPGLARGADAHVFGAGEPTEEHVAAYWAQIDEMRSTMRSSLGRFKGWGSALNPLSFLPLPKPQPKSSAKAADED